MRWTRSTWWSKTRHGFWSMAAGQSYRSSGFRASARHCRCTRGPLVVGDFRGYPGSYSARSRGAARLLSCSRGGATFIWTWPRRSTEGSADKRPTSRSVRSARTLCSAAAFRWAGKSLTTSMPRATGAILSTGFIAAYRYKMGAGSAEALARSRRGGAADCLRRQIPRSYGIRYQLEDGWLTARLLDGKKIYYWNPRRTTRPLPWDTWQSKDCWTYQATKQGRLMTVAAYGGLLTENVVMGLERQLLVRAMFRCEARTAGNLQRL